MSARFDRHVLVVDGARDARDACTRALRSERYRLEVVSGPGDALARVRAGSFDAAVIDLTMPGTRAVELLRAIRAIDPDIAIVTTAGDATIESSVEAMKEGVSHHVAKPFTPDELRLVLRRAIATHALVRENRELRARLAARPGSRLLVGESAALAEVRRLIARVAEMDSTVLVSGEPGTGKELVAREIHAASRRAAQPFIAVDCAAVLVELLESELFGHEGRPATGAVRRRTGSFELAHRGTVFLDEIGAMNIELQGKLLRALQERAIEPVGGERKIAIDVRIVAATNRNLAEATRAGAFREDLYVGLDAIPVTLPPLRARPEDIPALVRHFCAKHGRRLDRHIERVDDDALVFLRAYPWPGNVRELETTIERAVMLGEGSVLGPASFPHLGADARTSPAAHGAEKMKTLEALENEYILEVLQATRWNRRQAARILGISTVTLWRKLGGRSAEASTVERRFRSEPLSG